MFQKKIVEKYLSQLDKELLEQKYDLFCSIFKNETKIANIRTVKEEQYQEGFIRDVFCSVLNYTIKPEPDYNILTELKNETKNKNNARKSDGAICEENNESRVRAVIELKGTDTTDLDTVARQAFDYKSHHENCNYAIVCNFERLRLYVETQIEFIEFNLFTLTFEDFCILYLLLELNQLKADVPLKLKHETLSEEKQITDNFYADYSTFKRLLFEDLCENNPETDKLVLFKKTQKLLDRILFILFCEDRGLLPANSVMGIIGDYQKLKEMGYGQPLYSVFKTYFDRIDKGYKSESDSTKNIFAYNGGLFKPDETLDNLTVGDDVLFIHSKRLADYDFESQISVDILGRIFENSLTEIEEVQKEIEMEKSGEKVEINNIGKRKKDGVFYTPEYITKYIVENTIGKLCEQMRTKLNISDEEVAKAQTKKQKDTLNAALHEYQKWLFSLKILDPACGSGAFLTAALTQLKAEHRRVFDFLHAINNDSMMFEEYSDNSILENNLYGVDINEESVEITKLSLWLHTAQKDRKLTTLNNKIKCGNSLIDDPSVAGEKAFKWKEEFPEVFEKGGFDVVIGNPPYVQLQSIGKMSDAYAKCGYESYNKSADLYCLFTERGFSLLKKNGLQSFIMPNKWMLADYGKELRKFMSKTSLQQIINFGDVQFFKDAATIVCIFVIKKSEEKNKVLALSLNQKTYKGNFLQEIKDGLQEFSHETFNENIWQINDKRITMIFNKMKTIGKPLKNWAVEINNGIKTGFNDAFYIDEKKKHDLINHDSRLTNLIKPMLRGEDVGAFYPNFKDLYLINFHNGIKARNILPLRIEDYPVLKTHFDKYFEKLSKRSDKGITPYNLRNCAYLDYFDKPKIMYSEITKFFPFMLDNKGMFCNNKVFFITAKDDTVSLSFLTAVFNSKLCKLWIWYNCPELLGGTREIRKAYFENFPIPDLKNSEFSIINSELANLADKMLTLNETRQKSSNRFINRIKENLQISKTTAALENFYELEFKDFVKELTKQKVKLSLKQQDEWEEYFTEYKNQLQELQTQIIATDKEINALVYKLYGLTEEEIKVVEGR